jgi:hypothetical protein
VNPFSDLPTVFHITHWKTGSQWIYQILQGVAPERIVPPKNRVAHFKEDPIIPGRIYPTLYVSRDEFELVDVPENHIRFVVIRDLRDTLVSRYFSLKVSHPVTVDIIAQRRSQLTNMSLEEGLLYVIRALGKGIARIQSSWLDSDELFVKYEDLIADEYTQFKRIIDHCQIKIEDARLREVVKKNSFENRSGRQKGEEDVQSHYRKGVVGDWRNYFTDNLKAEFKERYGEILIAAGYEANNDW